MDYLYYVLIAVVVIAAVVISLLCVALNKAKRDLKTSKGMFDVLLLKIETQTCREILNDLQGDIGYREVNGLGDDEETVNKKNLARKINFTLFADEWILNV